MKKSRTVIKLLAISSGVINIILLGFPAICMTLFGKWFEPEFIICWSALAVALLAHGVQLLIRKKPSAFILLPLALELFAGLVTVYKSASWLFFYSSPAVITALAVAVSLIFASIPTAYAIFIHKTNKPKRKVWAARLFVVPLAFYVFGMVVAFVLSVFAEENYMVLLTAFLLIRFLSNALLYLAVFVEHGKPEEIWNMIKERKKDKTKAS